MDWIPRVQECENRIAEMQRRVRELTVARNYVSGEADYNAGTTENCSRALCQLKDLIDALLGYVQGNPASVPDGRVTSEIQRIAQIGDDVCRRYAIEADQARRRSDGREDAIERVIVIDYEDEEEERLSEAPGYEENEFSDDE